ncbi:MAG: phosphatase PAP2 family protein [Nitrosomonadales bacterium]|nr:phosphatase PAP2 family protein [Nitrosomonadales bacterium]
MTSSSTAPAKPGRFYLLHVGVPLLLALALLIGFETTDLDRMLNDLFYDPVAQQFPLRYNWFLEVIMHRWAKYLLVLVGVAAFAGFAASFLVDALRTKRRTLLYIFLVMALGPGSVSLLKDATNKHCPYDLSIYGGTVPYKRLFEPAVPDTKKGECFPGGHASGGFGLIAFYFVWRRSRPRWAIAALGFGFVYGFILGFGRLVQGAHFLSHNLWAAVVVWFVALVLYLLILYPQEQASVVPG